MRVSVRLFGLARKVVPAPELEEEMPVELPEGARICDLLKKLGLPSHRSIATIGKRIGRWNTPLSEGDLVQIVMPPGGG